MGRNNNHLMRKLEEVKRKTGSKGPEYDEALEAAVKSQENCNHKPESARANRDSLPEFGIKKGDSFIWCPLCSKVFFSKTVGARIKEARGST